MKIEVVRLYNDSFIIGELTEEDNGKIVLKNPRIVLMIPGTGNQMNIALKPVCFPFTSKRLLESITLQKSQIMFRLADDNGEIEKQLIDGYMFEVTGIKLASSLSEATAYTETANACKSGDVLVS